MTTINKEQGFTLVELMIVIAIAGIVLGALSKIFIIQRKVYGIQEQITAMTQNVRGSVYILTGELQMAGYSPTQTSFDGIPYHNAQLQISSDLNGDGDTNDTNENIIYTYDSTTLQIFRNAGGGAESLAGNIETFNFEFLDSAGATTTITQNIRQIRITIIGRTSKPDPDYAPNSGYRQYVLSTLITPKNLSY